MARLAPPSAKPTGPRLEAELVVDRWKSAPGHRPRHAVVTYDPHRGDRQDVRLHVFCPGCGTGEDLRMVDGPQAGCGFCPSLTASSTIA
jgi:hypothetical protein